MSKEKQCECCHEWWYDSNVKENLCPNCYDYFKQLKQQLAEKEQKFLEFQEDSIRNEQIYVRELAEKDCRIEELEGQFAYECECNKQLVELQKQLEKKQNEIAELEQDLEFTTKTANELIEIKHKLEQELAELKEKAIVPRFKRQEIVYCFSYGKIQLFNVVAYLDNQITLCENRETGKLEFVDNNYLCLTEQEAKAKLQELRGGE